MPDVTLWADEIKAAPPEVRRWLEREAIRNFCLLGERTGMIMQEDLATKKEVRTDEPTREGIRHLIAVRAYEMWENQGRPHGCDLIHWRQAEQEIMTAIGRGRCGSA